MKTPLSNRWRWNPTASGRFTLLIGLVLIGAFAAVAWVQSRQFSLLHGAQHHSDENVVWGFQQLEKEALLLHEALRGASAFVPLPLSQAALLERYEIFVSRVKMMDPQANRHLIAITPQHVQTHARLEGFVATWDKVLTERAMGRIPPQTLSTMVTELHSLRDPLQRLTQLASRLSSERNAARNEAIREQIHLGIGLTIFLSLAMLAFAIIVVRQLRAAEQRGRELEGLAQGLREASTAADGANRAKSAFLANMSHELRTPFNGLLGMLALLDDTPLNAEQSRFVHTAREAAEHLLAVLNDILDISRLEAGRLSLQAEVMDLHRVLGDVETVMAPSALAKGLALHLSLDPALPRWVRGDPTRIKQILFNLLSNAIKFTDQGQVALAAQQEVPGSATSPARISLTVQDSGIGMDEATQRRLFQRFSQGDHSITRKYGGTGLGLEISRSLARLMHGDLTVTSQPNRGSVFRLTLPLPLCEGHVSSSQASSAAAATAWSTLPPLDILVAEDHETNRMYVGTLLTRLGHSVRFALNGEQALREAERQLPDLILMDIHMPGMDGLQATRALRARPRPLGDVPIIALTADTHPDTREQVRLVGMNDFLSKPFRWPELEAALRRLHGLLPWETKHPPTSTHLPAAARTDPAMSAPPTSVPAPPCLKSGPQAALPPSPRRARLPPGALRQHLHAETMLELCILLKVEGLRPLLKSFFNDDNAGYARLCEAVQNGEISEVPRHAHQLKGAAQLLGLSLLAQLASELEMAAKAHEPSADIRPLQEAWNTSEQLCKAIGFLP